MQCCYFIKWKAVDRPGNLAYSDGEDFGEYEHLCRDRIEEVDAREEELAEIANARNSTNDRFVAARVTVQNMAMNGSAHPCDASPFQEMRCTASLRN